MRLTLAFLCVSFGIYAQEADWSHFNIVGEANGQQSSDIVTSISISNYWDVAKGKFRTGIIGEHVVDKVPSLMLSLEKKVSLGNGYKTFKNVHVVDFYALFYNAVVAIQHLSKISSSFSAIKPNLPKEIFPDLSKTSALLSKFENASSSIRCRKCHLASYLANEKALVQKRGELLEFNAKDIKRMALHSEESEKKVTEEKKKLHFFFHEKLNTNLEEHHSAMNNIALEKATKYYDLSSALEEENYANQLASVVEEARIEAEIKEVEVQGTIEAFRYKYAELGRISQEDEYRVARVLHSQAEADKRTSEEAFRAVLDEVHLRFSWMYSDPLLVLQKGKWLLLGVLLLVVTYDVILLLPSLFLKTFDKYFIVRSPVARRHKIDSQGQELMSLHDAVIENEQRDLLVAYVQNVRRGGAAGTPLPNLLITGGHGCGKTFSAQKVCADTALPYVFISESDLGAGGRGALHLRELLSRKRSKFVVVIDGADFIVRSRKDLKTKGGPSRDAVMSHCFYVLLDAIKNNSVYLSVILTTSCPIGEIDRALLDRIDSTVSLQIPTTNLRLMFTVKEMKSSLLDFLPDDAKRQLCDPSVDEYLNDFKVKKHCKLFEATLSAIKSHMKVSPETELPVVATSTSKSFNVTDCACTLVAVSEGWSFRELHKFLSSQRTHALSSDDCILDKTLWSKHLASFVKSVKST